MVVKDIDDVFERFYTMYYPKAFSYTLKRVRSYHDAEDLVCDAFMYCYDHFNSFDPQKASIGTWLFLILGSRIKNYYRDHREHIPIDLVGEYIEDDGNYIDRAVELDALRQQLIQALKKMPERQCQIVIYRFFQNMDTSEVAHKLNMTEGNVRTQLSRALTVIKKCFEMNED